MGKNENCSCKFYMRSVGIKKIIYFSKIYVRGCPEHLFVPGPQYTLKISKYIIQAIISHWCVVQICLKLWDLTGKNYFISMKKKYLIIF